MRLLLTYCTVGLIYLASTQSSQANNIYTWTDSTGKIHFSDKPQDLNAVAYDLVTIPSVSIVKTPPLTNLLKIKSKRKRKASVKQKKYSGKKNECHRIKKQIVKIETKLRKRQQATNFDEMSEELSQLRWRKISKC